MTLNAMWKLAWDFKNASLPLYLDTRSILFYFINQRSLQSSCENNHRFQGPELKRIDTLETSWLRLSNSRHVMYQEGNKKSRPNSLRTDVPRTNCVPFFLFYRCVSHVSIYVYMYMVHEGTRINATVVPFYRSVPYDNRAAGTCKFSG